MGEQLDLESAIAATQPTLRGKLDRAPVNELDLSGCVAKLRDTLTELAQAVASAHNMPFVVAHDQLARALIQSIKGDKATAALDTDARTAKWRARIRLYDDRDPNEPQADTDPDLAPGHDGAKVLDGLPAVADWLIECARDFHGEQLAGLDIATLRHRLKSLRPTLSRRGGNAVWRVPYVSSRGQWTARVDVVRVPE